MKKLLALLFLASASLSPLVHAEDKESEHKKEGKEEHEENSAIGPEKGILEKGEKGFRLSPEASVTFGIKTERLAVAGKFPSSAVAEVRDKKFLYRLKDGWIKRIELGETKAGDEILVSGVPFVRIAELVAEEGLKDD